MGKRKPKKKQNILRVSAIYGVGGESSLKEELGKDLMIIGIPITLAGSVLGQPGIVSAGMLSLGSGAALTVNELINKEAARFKKSKLKKVM